MGPVIVALALGVAAGADPQVAKFLASPAAAPLARAGEVRAARVDSFFSSPNPPRVEWESLGFAAKFHVRPETSVLSVADADALRRVLGRATTYESAVSACMFEPGVAFTFPARSDLLVLVCFKCEEVGFVQGDQRLGHLALTKAGTRELLKISTRLFPELASASK